MKGSYKVIEHPLREDMLEALCVHVHKSKVDIAYIKTVYCKTPYKEIVRPLIIVDANKGISIQRMMIKYGLTENIIKKIIYGF